MPKILTILSMVVAALLFALFGLDVLLPATYAPFKRASVWPMDILMMVSSALLFYVALMTFREVS
ncbi:MAG: hypothetical protein MI757_08420 [Pirellulales bacterium]|nr:hypothetical protein [Pirellulales bacterium]